MKEMSERGKYWQCLIEEHAASGMTIKAFCIERKISGASFFWWRRELQGLNKPRKRSRKGSPPGGCGFVEVVSENVGPAVSGSGITLCLPGRVSIAIDRGFDRDSLTAVLDVLKASTP